MSPLWTHLSFALCLVKGSMSFGSFSSFGGSTSSMSLGSLAMPTPSFPSYGSSTSSAPFKLGSLSAPPPGTEFSFSSPYSMSSSGGYGDFPPPSSSMVSQSDYLRDIKLAEDKTKAAEKRETMLIDKIKALEAQMAANSAGGFGLPGGFDAQSKLRELAEQRASDAQRRYSLRFVFSSLLVQSI